MNPLVVMLLTRSVQGMPCVIDWGGASLGRRSEIRKAFAVCREASVARRLYLLLQPRRIDSPETIPTAVRGGGYTCKYKDRLESYEDSESYE